MVLDGKGEEDGKMAGEIREGLIAAAFSRLSAAVKPAGLSKNSVLSRAHRGAQ